MLTITTDNSAFKSYLDKLQLRLDDLYPVMDDIGMRIETRVSGRFETRTDPNGKSWAPWSPATKESYPKDGNRKLLDRYGEMIQHLSHQADKTSVRIGFSDFYSTFHEYGTKNMPRRGLLFADPNKGELSKSDEEEVLEVLYSWINKVGA
jgi:phage virion morphogenesis protein